MVNIDPKQKILLIDTSYFIFYRYYAVFNWYKLSQGRMIDVPNILQDEQFMSKYDKLFVENMEKLRKKHGIPHCNVIFAKDCMRENIWRFKYFAEYKKSREERLSTFNGDIFKYCYSTLLPRIEEQLGVQSCEYPCAEADDIIAIFTRKIHRDHPSVDIVIITNDNDYLQLIDEKTKLINMKNIDLSERLMYDPQTYLKIKIIMGDKSDNIPSVFQKCGEKRALALAQNEEELADKLDKSPEHKTRYELNKLLIDMTQVPTNIKDEIEDMLNYNDPAG